MGGFRINLESVDGNSHLLAELAGLLYAGRLDGDLATTARVPRSHPDIAREVLKFSTFADDQWHDLVALLGALSVKLKATGEEAVHIDNQVRDELERFLGEGSFVPPERR